MSNPFFSALFSAQVAVIVVLSGQRLLSPPPPCTDAGFCKELLPYYQALEAQVVREAQTARIETCMEEAIIAARTGDSAWRARAAETCLVYRHSLPSDPCRRESWRAWVSEAELPSRREALAEALFVAHCPAWVP